MTDTVATKLAKWEALVEGARTAIEQAARKWIGGA